MNINSFPVASAWHLNPCNLRPGQRSIDPTLHSTPEEFSNLGVFWGLISKLQKKMRRHIAATWHSWQPLAWTSICLPSTHQRFRDTAETAESQTACGGGGVSAGLVDFTSSRLQAMRLRLDKSFSVFKAVLSHFLPCVSRLLFSWAACAAAGKVNGL